MDELRTDDGRNELTDYLDAIERDGHAELADCLRKARREYLDVAPLYAHGEPAGLLEIRYRRQFKKIRIYGEGGESAPLGDDFDYIYETAPISEAELRSFAVDMDTLNAAWKMALEAGKTLDDMDLSSVKVTLAPYMGIDGKPILYVDMLLSIAFAALIEDGDDTGAGRFLELVSAWGGGKRWLDARRGAGEERNTAKGTTYLRDKSVMVTTDPVAGALFDPGRSSYIDPTEWWDESPKEIKSAKYGVVIIQPHLPVGIVLDDDPAEYRLTAKQRFWYETAEKLAREGYRTIRGVDLLKKRGYANPYRSTDVMKEAGRALYDLTGRRIGIDTTEQYSAKRRDGARPKLQLTMRPIIDGEYSFTVWDGGNDEDVRDFEIKLRGDSPVEAFALLEYQLDHKMFADIPGYDDCLEGMRKVTAEHRYMWNEVRRHMLIKHMDGDGKNGERRIRFDTLFRTLGMTGTEKKDADQRRHMIDALEKMLNRACRGDHKQGAKTVRHKQLFRSWRYLKDTNGRRYGVEITPL